MSSSMNTILIIGGSGGIGEAFARRFHSMGKKLIVTGRNEKKLNELKASCKGLETYIMNMADFANIPNHIDTLFATYPDIDTVWINGGIQFLFKFTEPDSSSDEQIRSEIDTNVTAPTIIARHVIPILLKRGNRTNFMITSSGLAFVPLGLFPVYCPSKAFVHHLLVGLRQQLAGTTVNVIEIAPPRVETELGPVDKSAVKLPAISLDEYVEKTFEILDQEQAENLREVAVGFAANATNAWRGSIGKILEGLSLGG